MKRRKSTAALVAATFIAAAYAAASPAQSAPAHDTAQHSRVQGDGMMSDEHRKKMQEHMKGMNDQQRRKMESMKGMMGAGRGPADQARRDPRGRRGDARLRGLRRGRTECAG